MTSEGLVDLHCHLLPQVDDGAKSLDETLQMARVLHGLGFTEVAPSPHNRPEYASRSVALLRLDEIKELFLQESVSLDLFQNSENAFIDSRLIESVGTERSRPIAQGPYLLVEAPYTSPLPALLEIIFQMKLKGVTPVIAHPERCAELQNAERAVAAVRAGALLQLDVGALIGRYGRIAQKIAKELLDLDSYVVAATDLHSPSGAQEWLAASLKQLEQMVGPKTFERLLAHNPRKILRGEPLE